jgi:hypothetical protein
MMNGRALPMQPSRAKSAPVPMPMAPAEISARYISLTCPTNCLKNPMER